MGEFNINSSINKDIEIDDPNEDDDKTRDQDEE